MRGPPLVVALSAGKAVRAADRPAKTGHRAMLVSCVAWPLEQFRGSPEHPGREVLSNPSRQAILCAGGSAHHGSGPPAPRLPPGASSAPLLLRPALLRFSHGSWPARRLWFFSPLYTRE